ncbi:heterokaryon incompatibility protein-domain-containing protein [Xylaria curta]|nr:heterokaryon incompatibility protein-domain-containing protein [Xylaria curta]
MQSPAWKPIQSWRRMWIRHELEQYWPRRLLYIPNMTSYQRVGDHEYNGVRCPPYSIISYTWGRWEVKGDERPPALPIKGVTWPIPAIQESHFTVETFQSVITQMNRDGIEWAWLDVACIDQTPGSVSKMDEIGHQAAIFQQAVACYVWLSRIPFPELEDVHSTIQACIRDLCDIDYDYRFANRMASSLRNALHRIFDDPWFSSLWTLQEIILRTDAVVLTSKGQPVITSSGHPFHMTGFINDCAYLYNRLDSFAEFVGFIDYKNFPKDSILNHISVMQDQIRRLGFHCTYTNNPNMAYGRAKYRHTQINHDRIYGIMQIYGVQVGETLRPGIRISYEDLVDELALAVNSKSPILGQLYLHTTRPPVGKSWRITENSTVPWDLNSVDSSDSKSSISKNSSGSILASGPMCSFDDFLEGQILASQYGLSDETARFFLDRHIERKDLTSGSSVAAPHDDSFDDTLDGDILASEPLSSSSLKQWTESFTRQWELGPSPMDQDRLFHTPYPKRISGDATYEMGKKIRLMNPERNLSILLLGDIRNEGVIFLAGIRYQTHVALILAESAKLPAPGSPQAYSRIGICTWNTLPTITEMEEILRKEGGGDERENKFLIWLRRDLKKFKLDSDARQYKFKAWLNQAFGTRVTIELE